MTTLQQPITSEQRRELEAIYRQQIGAIRALARLLGYPCPIANRAERCNPVHQAIDDRTASGILETDAAWSSSSSSGS